MSKYSSKFKLEVVNYYLNNHCSWEYVAKQPCACRRRNLGFCLCLFLLISNKR